MSSCPPISAVANTAGWMGDQSESTKQSMRSSKEKSGNRRSFLGQIFTEQSIDVVKKMGGTLIKSPTAVPHGDIEIDVMGNL